jgi:DNA polymerase III subunit chi
MVTSVAFHFNAPVKLAYACRLLRKAAAAGSTVAVVGDAQTLTQLDERLWSFSALDFVPHGRAARMTPSELEHTPIWLCETAQQGQGRQVLVNLSQAAPLELEGFDRLIEIVSQDETDRQSARTRWKHYAERGCTLVRHDLASSENT